MFTILKSLAKLNNCHSFGVIWNFKHTLLLVYLNMMYVTSNGKNLNCINIEVLFVIINQQYLYPFHIKFDNNYFVESIHHDDHGC